MNEKELVGELRGIISAIRIGATADGEIPERVRLRVGRFVESVESSFVPGQHEESATGLVAGICDRLRHIAEGQSEWPRNDVVWWLRSATDMVESLALPSQETPAPDGRDEGNATGKATPLAKKPLVEQARTPEEILKAALRCHHRFDTDDLNQTPLKLQEMADATGRSKAQAGRYLKQLGFESYANYERVCADYSALQAKLELLDGKLPDQFKTNLQNRIARSEGE